MTNPKLKLYIHTPVPIFKARVNMALATYPVASIIYDGVTLGAYTDIQFDATLTLGTTEGGDDLGRVRVTKPADSNKVYVSRSGKGTVDGSLVVQNNAYLTVWDDYRVWAKIPYYDLDEGIDFKDGDIPVGNYTSTEIPPVSNCGPGTAGYVDTSSNVITVQFPRDGVNTSFAMTDEATIDTYEWDVKDGTITVGTSSDAVITATFPPGFRWVALTVTDSNGISHTSRCPVLSIDSFDDPTFKAFGIKQNLDLTGQTLDMEIYDDVSREDYPDGTLVMFWWDEASSPGDRNHMKFIGWLDKESNGVERGRFGISRSLSMSAVDVNGRLKLLPGFPQALTREDEEDVEEQWSLMPTLDMRKCLHYLAFWHSTALNVADFILPDNLSDYVSMRLDSGASTLFGQIDQQAQKIVPDHYLTCNAQGQLEIMRDWRLDDVGDRPTSAPIVQVTKWNEMQWEYNRHPNVHVLRSGAIVSSTDWIEVEGEDTLPLAFSIAPSEAQAFGQGTVEMTENEGLTLSQEELNKSEGHRYARLNSRFGKFTWSDPTGSDFWGLEPALMNRVQLNFSAIAASPRGIPFMSASGLVEGIAVEYKKTKFGLTIKPKITWTKEESGFPAIAYNPETDENEEAPYVPPVWGDEEIFYGDMNGYIFFMPEDIVRTWDLSASEPEWEVITNEIEGEIRDAQYFMPSPDTCGVWLMSSEGIWVCLDVMAETPSWSKVLDIDHVIATQAAPPSDTVDFCSMTHYWLQPGHLVVATQAIGHGNPYAHAYFWVTENYGNDWTLVDMNEFLFESSGVERCYDKMGLWGMDCMRTIPTIYCIRGTSRTGSASGNTAIFRSEDKGYTWEMAYPLDTWSPSSAMGSILRPFPDVSNTSWMTRSYGSTGGNTNIAYSDGGWTGFTSVIEPTGHGPNSNPGNFGKLRINKRTFDDNHAITLMTIDFSSNQDLYETYDRGATWELLGNFGNGMQTPNGWPPDPDQWVLIDMHNSPHIRLTLDNFDTFSNKDGNLTTVLPGGDFGTVNCDGFALPKVGPNA